MFETPWAAYSTKLPDCGAAPFNKEKEKKKKQSDTLTTQSQLPENKLFDNANEISKKITVGVSGFSDRTGANKKV